MRSIFFDVDGVLIQGYHYRPELRNPWDKDMLADLGVNPGDMKQAFFKTDLFVEVLLGKVTLQEALAGVLPTVGYTGEVQTFIDYWLKKDSNVNTALFEKLAALKQSGQVKLYIATCQENNRANYLMNTLGFCDTFEEIFNTGKLGIGKYTPDYFNKITELVDISGQEPPILFDDTPKVIEIANSCGWEGYEFVDNNDLYRCPFIAELLK